MKFKTAKKGLFPYGTWIIMSHREAHNVATSGTIDEILKQIAGIGPWGAAAAAAVFLQRSVIHEKNRRSGGKGVKALFVWAVGMVLSIERRGNGASPCC